jgi:uncharacterized membrane protein YfcA
MLLLVAALAGALIGLSLGALGAGGSILAVPVLVYLLGQSPLEATTGSLVVVAAAALMGMLLAHRAGQVYVGRGLAFALVGAVGAAVGATWSVLVDETVLMVSFAVLLLVVAGAMSRRLLTGSAAARPKFEIDAPIISVRPTFMCDCPRALKVVVAGVAVGVLTGFLGVGGGFLVVPALVLALGLPMPAAVGTSLLVITVNSVAAFGVRVAHGVDLSWPPLLVLTAAAILGSIAGRRVAGRVDPRGLSIGFVGLLVVVGGYTAIATLA